MATRKTAPRANAKSTVVDVEAIEVDAQQTHSAEAESEDVGARFTRAFDDYMASLGVSPTRRAIVGFIVGMLVAFGAGYLIGQVVSHLTLAVLLVSGSMFLATLVFVIGIIIAALAGGFLGNTVGAYIANGTAERHVSVAKSWVTGLFGRKPVTA